MLTSKSLTNYQIGHDATDKAFQNLQAVVNPVLSTPIIDGTYCQNLTIPANLKVTCNHGLGRAALGAHVTMASASVPTPYVVPSDQKQPTTSLVLTFASGAGAVISVWVF